MQSPRQEGMGHIWVLGLLSFEPGTSGAEVSMPISSPTSFSDGQFQLQVQNAKFQMVEVKSEKGSDL